MLHTLGSPPVRGAGRAGGWGRLGGLGPGAAAPEPPGTGSHFFPCCWNPRLFKLSGTETRLHSTLPSSSSPQQRCLLVANNELTLETLGAPFYLRTWTVKGKRQKAPRLTDFSDGDTTVKFSHSGPLSVPSGSCPFHPSSSQPTTPEQKVTLSRLFHTALPAARRRCAATLHRPTVEPDPWRCHPRSQMGPSSPREQKSPNCPACQIQGEAQGARAGR